MLTQLNAKDFKAVAHLETSQLMQSHPAGLTFSTSKPNVIVGPNGAGKSALMTALSLLTLCHFYEESSLDDNYTRGSNSDELWAEDGYRWNPDIVFLKGLTTDCDLAPGLFFRPSHMPGNDCSVTHAMMMGYMDIARDYGNSIDSKSSGQQSLVVLEKIRKVLLSGKTPKDYRFIHWSGGNTLLKPEEREKRRHCSMDMRAEVLKAKYLQRATAGLGMILMDEPEQSLDAKAEVLLWKQIAQADCSQMQVIVATHSLYPLMKPERFNIIEAVPGYAAEVLALV